MKSRLISLVFVSSAVLLSACNSSSSDDSANTPINTATSEPSLDGENAPVSNGADQNTDATPSTTPPTVTTPPAVTTPPQNTDTPVVSGGNATAFGNVNASYDSIEDATDLSATFFISPTPFPVSALNQEYIRSVSDSCKPLNNENPLFSPGDSDDVNPDNLPFVPQTVGAGEVITLTSAAGTYASLLKRLIFGFTAYQTQDDIPVAGPMPNGLVVNIPGEAGGFPAVSNLNMPVARTIEFSFSGSTITWTNSGEEGATVDILMSALSDGDVFNQVFIQCELVDDGLHEIAAGIIPAGNIETPLFSGTRSVTRLVQAGNSVLILSATSDGFLAR